MIDEQMAMEDQYCDSDRENQNTLKSQPQFHFIYQQSHMDQPGIKPGPLWWQAGDQLPEPWHILMTVV